MSGQRQKIRNLMFEKFELGNGASAVARIICIVTGTQSPIVKTKKKWYKKFRADEKTNKVKMLPVSENEVVAQGG